MVSSNQFNKRSIVLIVYLWLSLINKNDLASFNIESRAIIDDCRMNSVGGLSAGIEIWELAYLPKLLNNSDTWVEIDDSTIEKLENLQLMMYRVILNCPKSTHHAALLWDMGGILMRLRIIEKS